LEPVAAPLEGTVWQLETFITGETARSTLAGTTITAVFADGKVGGSAGCNQYSASYTLAGETLEVGEIITTKIACDAAIMAEEEEFLSALRQATSLAISGRQLEVAHPGGALVFRAGEEESS
jgi:heat shock protein HslJ